MEEGEGQKEQTDSEWDQLPREGLDISVGEAMLWLGSQASRDCSLTLSF